MSLPWREAVSLRTGEKVRFTAEYVIPVDPSDDEKDIRVPVGATAVVDSNLLKESGSLALEPDDKGLRAELNYQQSGLILLFLEGPEQPPPETSDLWDQLTPIKRLENIPS